MEDINENVCIINKSINMVFPNTSPPPSKVELLVSFFRAPDE